MDQLPLLPGLLSPQELELCSRAYLYLKSVTVVLNAHDFLLHKLRHPDGHINELLQCLRGLEGEWS